jgi:hypothetical protein
LLGSTIPASFELGFALPLTFSALLVPLLDRIIKGHPLYLPPLLPLARNRLRRW